MDERGDHWAENRNGVLVQAKSYRLWSLWFLGRYRSAGRNLDLAVVWAQDPKNMKKIGHLLTFAIILMRFFRLPDRIIGAVDTLEDSIRTMQTEGWPPQGTGSGDGPRS